MLLTLNKANTFASVLIINFEHVFINYIPKAWTQHSNEFSKKCSKVSLHQSSKWRRNVSLKYTYEPSFVSNIINFKLIINTNNNSTIAVYLVSILYFFITWNLLKYIWNSSQTIILTGDIEMNPGMRSHSLPMPFNLSLNFRGSLCLLPKLATSESY